MNLHNVILRPIVTEKTSNLLDGKVVVEISPRSTKVDVKAAFKLIYGFDVELVNIVNTRQKFKFAKKGLVNKKSTSKKAYVTLKDKTATVDFIKTK